MGIGVACTDFHIIITIIISKSVGDHGKIKENVFGISEDLTSLSACYGVGCTLLC